MSFNRGIEVEISTDDFSHDLYVDNNLITSVEKQQDEAGVQLSPTEKMLFAVITDLKIEIKDITRRLDHHNIGRPRANQ